MDEQDKKYMELKQQLINKYPRIYSNVQLGFDFPLGWFNLFDKLGADIMATDLPNEYRTIQIKSKFGELRFYYENGGIGFEDLIDNAENESRATCENCGSKENVSTGGYGWIMTLCNKCRYPNNASQDSQG